jgi:tRNA threonylcarbamoyladenosine biosynthesis protein TsaB
MLVLGINTVADACDAALVRDGVVVAELTEPMQQGHDARLAPVVEKLMRDAGIAFADLNRVCVIVGPGSFTGVRVGVAFARGLSLSLDIPAVGVTSLEALDGLPLEGRVLGVLPAKRRPPARTWWGQLIDQGRGAGEAFEATEDELRARVAGVDAICGGLSDIPDLGAPRVAASPSAKAAAIFVGRLSDDDLPPPRPVYVREPDATPMRPVGP